MSLAVCESADDVRRLARKQAEWRKKQYELQQRVAELEHIVERLAPEPSEPIESEPKEAVDPDIVVRIPITTSTRIIDLVCARFKMTLAQMLSNRRTKEIVRPRQIAMWLCSKHTKLSLPQVGRKFGGKDHTTVLHAIRKIEGLRSVEPNIETAIVELEAELFA